MVKQLTRTGNSVALIIDRPILEMMHADENSLMRVELDGRRLIITPADPAERAKFDAAKTKSHRRYGKTYKDLAK